MHNAEHTGAILLVNGIDFALRATGLFTLYDFNPDCDVVEADTGVASTGSSIPPGRPGRSRW